MDTKKREQVYKSDLFLFHLQFLSATKIYQYTFSAYNNISTTMESGRKPIVSI